MLHGVRETLASERDIAERGKADMHGEPVEVVPHVADLLPGWDPSGFNRLADELEDEAAMQKAP